MSNKIVCEYEITEADQAQHNVDTEEPNGKKFVFPAHISKAYVDTYAILNELSGLSVNVEFGPGETWEEQEEHGGVQHFSIDTFIRGALAVDTVHDPTQELGDHYMDEYEDPDCDNDRSWYTRAPAFPHMLISDDSLIGLCALKEVIDTFIEKYVPDNAVLIDEEHANKETQ